MSLFIHLSPWIGYPFPSPQSWLTSPHAFSHLFLDFLNYFIRMWRGNGHFAIWRLAPFTDVSLSFKLCFFQISRAQYQPSCNMPASAFLNLLLSNLARSSRHLAIWRLAPFTKHILNLLISNLPRGIRHLSIWRLAPFPKLSYLSLTKWRTAH